MYMWICSCMYECTLSQEGLRVSLMLAEAFAFRCKNTAHPTRESLPQLLCVSIFRVDLLSTCINTCRRPTNLTHEAPGGK